MRKLEKPTSQMQEVLYELIYRISIDRRTMMLSSGVWNLTARISDLRKKGLNITSEVITSKNKYGREIEFVHYSLPVKKQGIDLYIQLKQNQHLYERFKK